MLSQRLFLELLDKCVSDAQIRLLLDGGAEQVVGAAPKAAGDGPSYVAVRVLRPRFFARVLAYGNLGLGEAYMDGDFEIAEGALEDLLIILLRNHIDRKIRYRPGLAWKVGCIRLANALRSKRGNIRRHYDLGEDLFENFLDPTMAYSCGYVGSPGDDLAQLQLNKYERICRKLRLQPGDRLLDIGSGFAGLLIHAAQHYGVTATGITNSQSHFDRGRANVLAQGLAGRIQIEFKDFRALSGRFEKVVTVGMMEHVPPGEYRAFVKLIADALTPQGLGLIHIVGCVSAKNVHDPFIQKYILPGSGQLKLSQVAAELERNRLAVLDVENIGRHYAPTARGWLKNFRANKARLDGSRYDEAFLRMWEYYLCCGLALAAVGDESVVYQILFTKDYAAPHPLHRL